MTECIVGRGRINDRGYCVIWHEGKASREHRVAFALANGLSMADIRGVEIRHSCDNPRCVNPKHLLPGTHTDNMRDMIERGRHVTIRGSEHKLAKLDEAAVRRIRDRVSQGEKRAQLAREFGVDPALIARIVLRKSWSHVQ